MNRTVYTAARRSIRDNGLRYTAQHAIDTDDTDTLIVCDELYNVGKETDWLAMRAQFARTTPGAVAIRLTTTVTL